MLEYKFTAQLWEYHGDGAWHFVTIPKRYAAELRLLGSEVSRGFGSIKVKVTLGVSTWQTSLFPDKQSQSYVLPIKKEIRTKNAINAGDELVVRLELAEA